MDYQIRFLCAAVTSQAPGLIGALSPVIIQLENDELGAYALYRSAK